MTNKLDHMSQTSVLFVCTSQNDSRYPPPSPMVSKPTLTKSKIAHHAMEMMPHMVTVIC